MTIALDEKQYEKDLKEAYKLGYEQGKQGYHDGSFHYFMLTKYPVTVDYILDASMHEMD